VLLDKRDPKSALVETLVIKSRNESRAKFGKETVSGVHRRPKWCSRLYWAG
jgi:hypothetical protein